MNDIDVFEADLDGQDLRIAIVQARFNEEHCQALSESCINELLALGVSHADIQLVTVPGALEIPFALSQLVKTDEFDALIALGAVIRGETYHFELVSNESASGFGIENSRQRLDFIFGNKANFEIKNLNENEVITKLKIKLTITENEEASKLKPTLLNYITIPPQTLITWPVMYELLSDPRKTHKSATSSAFPALFNGIPLTHSLTTF